MKLFSAAVLATAVSAGTKNRRASDPPQYGLSCKSAKGPHQSGNGIWQESSYNGKNFNKCIFSTLLNEGRTGRGQMQRAFWFLDQTQNYNKYLDPLITDWKVLTGQHAVQNNDEGKIDCGFAPVAAADRQWIKSEGYINQCGLMCSGLDVRINDADSAKLAIKEFLNGYMTILNDQFGERFKDASSCFYDETSKGKHVLLGHDRDGWVNQWNDVCKPQDRCKQLVINTYGTIAKFESILGEEIPNLNRQFQKDMDYLLKKDENGFYDDLFRSGIYGIHRPDGPLVQEKREHREAEFRSRNPDRFKTN